MSDTQAIKVLIADDEPGMRLILRKMIARVEGYELVGEAQDGEQLIALFEQHRPQVVFLDVDMPVMNGAAWRHPCSRYIRTCQRRTGRPCGACGSQEHRREGSIEYFSPSEIAPTAHSSMQVPHAMQSSLIKKATQVE